MLPASNIIYTDYNELLRKWSYFLSKVKTIEDFNKLSPEEQSVYKRCNLLIAPSYSLKPSKCT